VNTGAARLNSGREEGTLCPHCEPRLQVSHICFPSSPHTEPQLEKAHNGDELRTEFSQKAAHSCLIRDSPEHLVGWQVGASCPSSLPYSHSLFQLHLLQKHERKIEVNPDTNSST